MAQIPKVHSQPAKAQTPPKLCKFTICDIVPLALLVTMRLVSIFLMIISDCDEVFNYWEPLNFLLRGFGKQTWEYSPEYSIRSWAYLLPYYVAVLPYVKISKLYNASSLGASAFLPPYYGFYLVRAVLGLTVLTGEIRLYYTLKKYISVKLAFWFGFFSAVSTGMTHGSIALLPSSFALGCNIFAITSFIHFYFTSSISYAFTAIFWYSIAGLLGWPFSLVLAVPMILYTLSYTLITKGNISATAKFIGGSAAISGGLLVVIVGIDSTLYQKFSVVPLNIFLYNVLFADEESGPNIFGTEPFGYYPLNLLLNFNLIFILAYAGLISSPIIFRSIKNLTQEAKKQDETQAKTKPASSQFTPLLVILLLAPLFIWSVIFGSQPHKEERFLYPIYPLINLSAAIFWFLINDIVSQASKLFGTASSQKLVSPLIKLTNFALVAVVFLISVSRTIQLITDYSAPLHVYDHLPANATGNVCIGREWYRYPSSFFLPNEQTRVRFVKSGFNGLLPGDFEENKSLIGAISIVPKGMNNKNLFDAGKVTDFLECSYYVDIDENIDLETGEHELLKRINAFDVTSTNEKEWKIIHCEKFIDNGKSRGIGRVLYLPTALQRLLKTKVHYHNYCLLERRQT